MSDYVPFRLVAINLSVNTKTIPLLLFCRRCAVHMPGGQAGAEKVASKHWLVNYGHVSNALQFWTNVALKCWNTMESKCFWLMSYNPTIQPVRLGKYPNFFKRSPFKEQYAVGFCIEEAKPLSIDVFFHVNYNQHNVQNWIQLPYVDVTEVNVFKPSEGKIPQREITSHLSDNWETTQL